MWLQVLKRNGMALPFVTELRKDEEAHLRRVLFSVGMGPAS